MVSGQWLTVPHRRGFFVSPTAFLTLVLFRKTGRKRNVSTVSPSAAIEQTVFRIKSVQYELTESVQVKRTNILLKRFSESWSRWPMSSITVEPAKRRLVLEISAHALTCTK
jgi:hypothetical protein